MPAKRIAKENKWGDKSRFYHVKDKEYPSVTTILSCIGKPALVQWSANVERQMVSEVSADLYLEVSETPKMSKIGWLTTLADRLGKTKANQKELAKASEIGSQAHAMIEWNLRARMLEKAGPPPMISDKAQWSFRSWEDWAESVELKPILIEHGVYSELHGYAGTADLLAEINGKQTLLDWKTGKAIYPEAHLQNAAYRSAIREMGCGNPEQGLIVRLPKVETDPNFEVVEALPESECMPVFLSTLKLWYWLERNSKG
jgi:hypothetical protein